MVKKHEDKGPFGRHKHRWEVNIKMDRTGREAVEWMKTIQDRIQL
jgi:hypothetical protein